MARPDSTLVVDGDFIARYLSGESTAEEAIQLENWIALSASNKLLFDQYVATWAALESGDTIQVPDKAGAWGSLQQLIHKSKPVPVRRFPGRYHVAAIVAGIAFLSIIPFIFFSDRAKKHVAQTSAFATSTIVSQKYLPDRSLVVLNTNSRLNFPSKFENDRRTATLHGEAFFSITPDSLRPFSIEYEGVTIEVLGTSFNVRKNPETQVVETQVNSGRVRMFNQSGEVIITAGQTGLYNRQKNSFQLEQALNVNVFSYATRKFVFSDEELGNIIQYLEKAYSKKIVVQSGQLSKCKMTSSFDGKSIEYILDVIATTLDIRYTIQGDIIYIEGGDHAGC